MNATDLKNLTDIINSAGNIATLFAPQYTAFIVLGQAIAQISPVLYEDIVKLFSKDDYTEAEVQELAVKINALMNPENIV